MIRVFLSDKKPIMSDRSDSDAVPPPDHHHLDVIKLLAAKVLANSRSTSPLIIVHDDVMIVKEEAAKVVAEVIKTGSRPTSAALARSRPTSGIPRHSQKSEVQSLANTSVNSIINDAVSRQSSARLSKTSSFVAPIEEETTSDPVIRSTEVSARIKQQEEENADKELIQSIASESVKVIISTASRPASAANSAKIQVAVVEPLSTSSSKKVPEIVHSMAALSVSNIISTARSSRPPSAAVSRPSSVPNVPSVDSVKESGGVDNEAAITATTASIVTDAVHLVAQNSVKNIITTASNNNSRPPSAAAAAAAPEVVSSVARTAVSGILSTATSRPTSAVPQQSSKVESTPTTKNTPPSTQLPSRVPSSSSMARPASAPVGEAIHLLATNSVSAIVSAAATGPTVTAHSRPQSAAAIVNGPRSPNGKDLIRDVQHTAESAVSEAIVQAVSRPTSAVLNTSTKEEKPQIVANSSSKSVKEAHNAAVSLVSDVISKSTSRPSSAVVVSAPITTSATTVSDVVSHPSKGVHFNEVSIVLPAAERESLSVVGTPNAASGNNNNNVDTIKMFNNFAAHHPGSAVINAMSLDFVTTAVHRGSHMYTDRLMSAKKKGVNFDSHVDLVPTLEEGLIAHGYPPELLSEVRDTEEYDSGKYDHPMFRSLSGLTEATEGYSSTSVDMFQKFSSHHPDFIASTSSDGIHFSAEHVTTIQNTASNTHIEAAVSNNEPAIDEIELQIYEDLSETPILHQRKDFVMSAKSLSVDSTKAVVTKQLSMGFSPMAGTTVNTPVIPTMILPSEVPEEPSTTTTTTTTDTKPVTTSPPAAAAASAVEVIKASPRPVFVLSGPSVEHISPRPVPGPAVELVSPRLTAASNGATVFNATNGKVVTSRANTTSVSPPPSPSNSMMSDVQRFSQPAAAPSAVVALISPRVGVVPGPKIETLLDSLVKGSPRLTSQQAVTSIMKISPRLVSPRPTAAAVAAPSNAVIVVPTAVAATTSTAAKVGVSAPSAKENILPLTNKYVTTAQIEGFQKHSEQERSDISADLKRRQAIFAQQERRIQEAIKSKSEMETLLQQLEKDLHLMDEKRNIKNNTLMEALVMLQQQMEENNKAIANNGHK